MKIGFIGLGNMASAMIDGILKNGIVNNNELCGAAKTKATQDKIAEKYNIKIMSNKELASWADILFLAVKPQVMDGVLDEIKDSIRDDEVVVSIAAGKTISYFEDKLGNNKKIVRLMPNTPAMVNAGMTAVSYNACVKDEELKDVISICESFGEAEVINENQMDAFCAMAGSSPAYVFMYLEALSDAGVKAGIPRDKAYKFAAQATMGSAKLMLETNKHPGVLKDMVCSPAGTTIEAVQVLEEGGFRATIMEAVEACVDKAKSM